MKKAMQRYPNLIKPIIHFSEVRIAAELQVDQAIQLNGMVLRGKILNGKLRYQNPDKVRRLYGKIRYFSQEQRIKSVKSMVLIRNQGRYSGQA